MTYRVNRALGYQPWGVTNPWVWANYGQPQRRRGYVSPMVFQTQGPFLKSAHLGDEGPSAAEAELLRRAEADLARGERMERYAVIGLTISAISAFMVWNRFYGQKKRVAANRRRRRRRSSRRRRR